MQTKTLLLVAVMAAAVAGIWLVLAGLPTTRGPELVTVLNYDPPGQPYALVVLRTGPGREHARMGFLGPGVMAEAIGRDAAGGWLLLREPHGWMSLSGAEVTVDVDYVRMRLADILEDEERSQFEL